MSTKRLIGGRAVATAAVLLGLTLAACGPAQDDEEVLTTREVKTSGNPNQTPQEAMGSITGGGISSLFGGGNRVPREGGGGGGGLGVNSFLWRASLDTISFMPVASADPFGGVIITDWYQPEESQDERFKVNLYILGRDLRANGLRAAVFRQVRENGAWADAPVAEKTATELENAILTRAREMRVAGAES